MFKSVKRILDWVGPYKKRLYLGCVCSFFSVWCAAGPVMLAAWTLGLIIDNAQGGVPLPPSLPWVCLCGIVGLILLRFFFSYWKNRLQESIGTERAAEQRIDIGDTLKRVSLGYFAKNNIGDILSALTTELSTLELQSMKMVDAVVNGYVQVVVIILCVGMFCPPAALAALIGVLLSAFALQGISRQSAHTAPVAHKAQEDLSGAAIEYIHGLSVVKSFGQEGVSVERFCSACRDNKEIRIINEFGFVPWNCLHLFFLRTASVGLVMIAAWQALAGALDLPFLLMAALFSFTIFGSVESINDAAHILSVTDSVLGRLAELDETSFIDQGGRDVPLDCWDVSFDHVSFSYGKREVIHDTSFFIPQNTTTAIVGPSGSGKSTLCSLLTRFYDVNAGVVTVGSHDVREFTCDSLLRNISMVFQNVYLFRDTVRNNICFGLPGATEEEIIAAAKAARCHEFIMALPDGYDTVVGEGGGTLSGGEKQRISIARAMLKDAPIIILDEATASVDPENEHEIQQAISALVHGKTIITIAHRLATIEQADQILVMDNGRIVQQGTHQELLQQTGVYQKFVQIRQQAEGWKLA
ncbi:ABC transporter ATP-binding protein/permease [Lacrimispora sp. NSJ-141]|uniref:ABC transporter ATP-binding protein/permease n=1 Tax=Lientehia hominis TaxID=2897778 RepID=A0AAP2RGI5_9FIRM|nr:ABC transporter ATP-binding protein [Lientehia hominis]MCD2491581.1 ABC transporter ATP-binding protein/permease [Lientehia hominis]